MKKLNLLVLGLALAVPSLARAGIVGSAHDFSTNSWNTTSSGSNPGRRGVCSVCHTAHGNDANRLVPLWHHGTTAASFTPYSSPTMNAAVGVPSGVSKACLSCHDGVTALNQTFDGGYIGGSSVGALTNGVIGTDLTTTHPISFDYDESANNDAFIYPKTTPLPAWATGTWPVASPTINTLLVGGRMECSSCHDVHKQVGASTTSGIMAKISGSSTVNSPDGALRGSTLCRTCHNK